MESLREGVRVAACQAGETESWKSILLLLFLQLIHRCWTFSPQHRPSFDAVKRVLHHISPFRESPVDNMMIMVGPASGHLVPSPSHPSLPPLLPPTSSLLPPPSSLLPLTSADGEVLQTLGAVGE